jgi:hypothetical protein
MNVSVFAPSNTWPVALVDVKLFASTDEDLNDKLRYNPSIDAISSSSMI